jgi:hypothetical protein
MQVSLAPCSTRDGRTPAGSGVSLRCAPGGASHAAGNDTAVASGAEPPALPAASARARRGLGPPGASLTRPPWTRAIRRQVRQRPPAAEAAATTTKSLANCARLQRPGSLPLSSSVAARSAVGDSGGRWGTRIVRGWTCGQETPRCVRDARPEGRDGAARDGRRRIGWMAGAAVARLRWARRYRALRSAQPGPERSGGTRPTPAAGPLSTSRRPTRGIEGRRPAVCRPHMRSHASVPAARAHAAPSVPKGRSVGRGGVTGTPVFASMGMSGNDLRPV